MNITKSSLTALLFCFLISQVLNHQSQSHCCKQQDPLTGKCILCDDNHFLDSTGQCQYKIGGCQTYKKNICLSCKQGFLLINNACQSDCGLLCNTNSGTPLPVIPSTNPEKINTDNQQQKKPKIDVKPPVVFPNQPEEKKKNDTQIEKPKPKPNDCVGDCDKIIIIDPYCSNYQNQKCTDCYSGYQLNQKFKCIIDKDQDDEQIIPSNCLVTKQKKCLQCVSRFWNNNGKCQPVDSNCNGFNPNNGQCIKCYAGFYLTKAHKCKLSNSTCQQTNKHGHCNKCYSGYQLTDDWKCILSQNNCKSYIKQKCIQCFGGYNLDDGKCKLSTPEIDQKDYNCRSWTDDGFCSSCYDFYRLKHGRCVLNDQNCAAFNKQGQCITCWATYRLQKGKCIATGKSLIDPACAQWNKNKQCSVCSKGFYLNHAKICIRRDPNCKIFYDDGHCKLCYPSFVKKNDGYCRHQIDVDCHQWENGKCTECSQGYYFNKQGNCTQIGPNCQTYNSKGQCLTCYPNNRLSDGKCKLVKIDTLCRKWKSNKCIQCSDGAFMNQGKCIQIDPNCLDHDENGICDRCSRGFEIIQNQCVQISPPKFQYQDNNCNLWKQGKCLKCADRSYFDENHKCQTVDPNCEQYTADGKCIECWTGVLISGKCDTTKVKDPNCKISKDQHCLQCSYGYFENKHGICTQVSTLCKTWCEKDGFCTSCFDSYTLTSGKCVYTPPIVFDSDFSADPNCADIDQNQKCIRCLPDYVLNTKLNTCIVEDYNCAEYDFNNSCCSKCYKGYNLKNGNCYL